MMGEELMLVEPISIHTRLKSAGIRIAMGLKSG